MTERDNGSSAIGPTILGIGLFLALCFMLDQRLDRIEEAQEDAAFVQALDRQHFTTLLEAMEP